MKELPKRASRVVQVPSRSQVLREMQLEQQEKRDAAQRQQLERFEANDERHD